MTRHLALVRRALALAAVVASLSAAGLAATPAVPQASAAGSSHGLHWSEGCGYSFRASSNEWVKEGCLVWMNQFRRWFWQDWDLRYGGVRAASGTYLDLAYGKWYVQVLINPATGAWVWNRASDFAIRQQVSGQWTQTWHQQICLQAFGRRC